MGNELDNGVSALTFGVELPNGKEAYPMGPTWLLYAVRSSSTMPEEKELKYTDGPARGQPALQRRESMCQFITWFPISIVKQGLAHRSSKT